MPLDEGRARSPAAQRFQPECAGAGEQIDGVFAPHGVPQQIEQCFPYPIFHRPGAGIAGKNQLTAAQRAADNSRRIVDRMRFSRA